MLPFVFSLINFSENDEDDGKKCPLCSNPFDVAASHNLDCARQKLDL
jgi:hypothetical protein